MAESKTAYWSLSEDFIGIFVAYTSKILELDRIYVLIVYFSFAHAFEMEP